VKNAKTSAGALLLGAEFLATLHGRSWLNQWENPLDPLALLKLVTCWTTLAFKVQATSILKSRENSMEKGVNQTNRANPSSRARRRVGGWHVDRAAVRVVPASGAHAEGPECPAITALCRRAPVCDVHGRWGVPSGEATLAGAPPAARHWPSGQPHIAEQCRPHRVCTGHRGDITNSQPTSHDYINKSPFVPRARTPPPELRRPS
jgi:hypothetical protein